ncbi:MAG TPA: methylated-DNA--[protein]-cysteine S-methyltransferase [Methylococcales bacterium]
MSEALIISIFPTKWGYFGLAATENGVLKTCLPLKSRSAVEKEMVKVGRMGIGCSHQSSLKGWYYEEPTFPKWLKPLEEAITAYFEGTYSSIFTEIPVDLSMVNPFGRAVLTACRQIPCGQTLTYTQLAKLAGKPKAIRAVATAVANNPIPLIIPCHRVIRSDGGLGGFSAPGGIKCKQKLLDLEKKCAI